ncbi:uncharacterized protein [Nicotiana tomentosiformis]|uniref:uncharacterized protein n=1 Tax=Nicotiana tomentosiformis TaxID=4098 RepID=UPI00388CB8F7
MASEMNKIKEMVQNLASGISSLSSRHIRNSHKLSSQLREIRNSLEAIKYSRGVGGKKGVGILLDRDLRELVVDVRRVNDKMLSIKLVVNGFTFNMISAYVPQVGLREEIKKRFWEDLDEVVHGFPQSEKVFIGGDFIGHVGKTARDNTGFHKREEQLVTFWSRVVMTQIDYPLLKKGDKGLWMDCKVIPSEFLSTHHRLLVMDLEIKGARKKRAVYVQPKIKWGALTKGKAQELTEKLLAMGGYLGGHKGDLWWNGEAQGNVKAKKASYLKLLGSTDEEDRRSHRECYKKARREAKVAVTSAKITAFEILYKDLGGKYGDKKLYKLGKIRERKAQDLDQLRCIKDEDGKVLVEEAGIRCRWQGYFHRLLNEEGDINIVLYRERKKDLHMVLIDLEKSYYKVPREVLWRCLEVSGVLVAYIMVIKDMYEGAKTRVRTAGGYSEHFPVEMGLHQGSSLSLVLFALALDVLTRHIQGRVQWCMLFDDDIVLID